MEARAGARSLSPFIAHPSSFHPQLFSQSLRRSVFLRVSPVHPPPSPAFILSDSSVRVTLQSYNTAGESERNVASSRNERGDKVTQVCASADKAERRQVQIARYCTEVDSRGADTHSSISYSHSFHRDDLHLGTNIWTLLLSIEKDFDALL